MHQYRCQILRVVDGDTVDIDIDLGFGVWMRKQRVRLYGVDTPESRTRDLEEKKFGMMAKKYVKGHLPVGSDRKFHRFPKWLKFHSEFHTEFHSC